MQSYEFFFANTIDSMLHKGIKWHYLRAKIVKFTSMQSNKRKKTCTGYAGLQMRTVVIFRVGSDYAYRLMRAETSDAIA